jgi:hypothetical protein
MLGLQTWVGEWNVYKGQGGQIGRIFAPWVSVYFGHFLLKTKVAHIFNILLPRFGLSIDFVKNGLGCILGDFFRKPIWSPW